MTVSAFAARHILAPKPPPAIPTPPLAGYSAWYDAAQLALADGAVLTSWPDLSGNAKNLSQTGTGGSAVFYKTTPAKLVNGNPTVWYTAGSDLRSATYTAVPQPFTMFGVAGPTGNQNFIDGASRVILGVSNGNNWYMYGPNQIDGTTAPKNGSVHVLAGVYNGATSTLYVDGAVNASGNVGANSNNSMFVAGFGNSVQGPSCEYLFYPFALTAPQVASVSGYLKTKWGTP